jgi:hypothetical protein
MRTYSLSLSFVIQRPFHAYKNDNMKEITASNPCLGHHQEYQEQTNQSQIVITQLAILFCHALLRRVCQRL